MTPNNSSNLILYKASAGSGKTFMLAVEYIAMLVKNPNSYKSILAVTFTNKATAEMKQRILSRLYEIAYVHDIQNESCINFINKVKELVTTKSDEEIRKNCKIALDNILQDYGHFRVETIDSFFQSILRSLARELQLGASLNLELDTEKVISDAVTEFLANVDNKTAAGKAVKNFITENIDNDRKWSIEKNLEDFSKQLFNETFTEKGSGLKELIKKGDSIPTFRDTLVKKVSKLETQTKKALEELVSQIDAAIKLYGMNGDKALQKNTIGLISKIKDSRIIEDKKISKVDSAFFRHCRNYIDPHGKNSGNTDSIFLKEFRLANPNVTHDWENNIAGYFQEAYDLIINYIKENNTYEGAIKYLYEVGLLMEISETIKKQNVEKERFVLADTASLLEGLRTGDTSFVFEKTGSFTDHIMIDEFQDTSRMQWKNFYMLLLECLSNSNRSLVVGDVKQSIYRWRNSDWNIFNEEVEQQFSKYSPRTINLDTNRRSLSNVIHFNNQLFEHSKKAASDSFKELSGYDHRKLITAYEGASQIAPKENGGYICMDISKMAGNQEEKELAMIQKIKEYLDMLTSEKGVNPNEIAILFRKKTQIYKTAKWFAENTDYKMVSSEAFRLDSSSSVRILANTMKWLANRTATTALATMLWEWNTAILGRDISIDATLQGKELEDNLPDCLKGQWDVLRHLPLYELVERLYSTLHLEKATGDTPYIMAFFDSVSDFIKRNPNDITLFVKEWEERICSSAIPASAGDGIRLFTIHKSKGLEFPTLIVPFCNWKLYEEASQFKDSKVWVNTRNTRVSDVPLLPIRFDGYMKDSDFHDDYIEEASQQYVDNMNLLYVAFTRAKCNLIAIGSTEAKDGDPAVNVADLIKDFMCGRTEIEDNGIRLDIRSDETVYEIGNIPKPKLASPDDEEDKDKKEKKDDKQKNKDNPFETIPEKRTIQIRTSGIKANFQQSGDSKRFVFYNDNPEAEAQQQSYIDNGLLFHEIFESITTEESVDACVDQKLSEGLIESDKKATEIKKLIHSHIKMSKHASEWFNGEFRLYNEMSILCKLEKFARPKRPDRVMVFPDKRVIVIDYKFGKMDEDHKRQVLGYMDLLKSMGYENVQGFVWYVFMNKVIEC